jgi:hypothetical protein
MGSAEPLKDTCRLLTQATKSLGDLIEKIKLNVTSHQNNAKQMAHALVDKLPLLIGNEA